MIDTLMRRAWVSPWTRLFLAVLCFLGAPPFGRGFWAWFSLVGAISWLLLFQEAGSKRWGSGA